MQVLAGSSAENLRRALGAIDDIMQNPNAPGAVARCGSPRREWRPDQRHTGKECAIGLWDYRQRVWEQFCHLRNEYVGMTSVGFSPCLVCAGTCSDLFSTCRRQGLRKQRAKQRYGLLTHRPCASGRRLYYQHQRRFGCMCAPCLYGSPRAFYTDAGRAGVCSDREWRRTGKRANFDGTNHLRRAVPPRTARPQCSRERWHNSHASG